MTVLGFDPDRQKQALKDRIGVCLQATNLPDKITVHEALELFARFYTRRSTATRCSGVCSCGKRREADYATLSGGQKQRLALALALINDPQMLFLDEPTTGLDPQVRLEIRDLVEELRAEKRTILMTTHYIEEAERLCDRVAIIDDGGIIAIGSPRELQEKSANQSGIEVSLGSRWLRGDLPAWPEAIACDRERGPAHIEVGSKPAGATLVEMVKWIDGQGLEIDDVQLETPDLGRCLHRADRQERAARTKK